MFCTIKKLKCYIWLMLRHYIAFLKNYVQLSPGNQELLVSWGKQSKVHKKYSNAYFQISQCS